MVRLCTSGFCSSRYVHACCGMNVCACSCLTFTPILAFMHAHARTICLLYIDVYHQTEVADPNSRSISKVLDLVVSVQIKHRHAYTCTAIRTVFLACTRFIISQDDPDIQLASVRWLTRETDNYKKAGKWTKHVKAGQLVWFMNKTWESRLMVCGFTFCLLLPFDAWLKVSGGVKGQVVVWVHWHWHLAEMNFKISQ